MRISSYPAIFAFLLILCGIGARVEAIQIQIDYTYDTNSFFAQQERRDALQAAADRWADVITSSLDAVDASYAGGTRDWRVGFTHPGTGASGFEISTASSQGTDNIFSASGNAAEVYDPTFALPADTWILFAGGRSLTGAAGVGGTGTGLNFTSTLDDPNGPHRRGLGVTNLPVWGGSISFDSDGSTAWHFDTSTAASGFNIDFYSIAVHEIGHALGLSTSFDDFADHAAGSNYQGPNAVAAYNADNGTSVTSLNLVSSTNLHWEDGTYQSEIFADGNPNYVGTVGAGNLQDLIMEPTANFTATIRRFELTNVDVGAAEDIGWSIVPEPSTWVLAFIGLLGLSFAAWRRARRK